MYPRTTLDLRYSNCICASINIGGWRLKLFSVRTVLALVMLSFLYVGSSIGNSANYANEWNNNPGTPLFPDGIDQSQSTLLESPEFQFTGFIEIDDHISDSSNSFVSILGSSLVLFGKSEITYRTTNAESSFNDVSLKFVGSEQVQPIGRIDSSGSLNFFYGQSSLTDVSIWNEIWYSDIYPGIDLRYYFLQNHLKYEFFVNPEATPTDILMRYEGQEEILVLSNSVDIHLNQGAGVSLRDTNLRVFQKDGVKVNAEFCETNYQVGFRISEYDTAQQLIIDPLIELDYGSYLGGEKTEQDCRAVVGNDGSIYVAGTTYSSFFPLLNPIDSYISGTDCFVSKLDPSGTVLLYSTFIGGSQSDGAKSLALDSEGNVYVTGYTTSTNFPRVNTETYATNNVDCFVFKLNSNGNALFYSCFIDGNDKTFGNDIAVGTDGAAYITGYCYAEILNGKANFVDIDEEYGQYNLIVAKVEPSGMNIAYTGLYGGSEGSYGNAITVDEEGKVYILGYCISADFPLDIPMMQFAGARDVVLMVLDDNCSQVFSSFIGGEKWEHGMDLVVKESGIVYFTGVTISDDFPTNALAFCESRISDNAYMDCFIVKLDTKTREIAYSTYLGGSEEDCPNSITVDEAGKVYVTGWTSSRDFPSTTKSDYSYFLDKQGFFSVLSEAGTHLLCSTLFGGSSNDQPLSISLDTTENPFIAGTTASYDFPVVSGYNNTYGGSGDGFLIKFALNWTDLDTPLLNTPEDILMNSGATQQITWKIYDSEAVTYQVLINGSVFAEDVCYPEIGVVQVDVSQSTIGVYNYTINAWNSQESHSIDTVLVFVEPPSKTNILLFLSISVVGSAGIVVLVILELRDRQKLIFAKHHIVR